MLKYRNKPILVDGYRFSSHKEANRYFDLKLLERGGEISNLELQPKFEIIPSIKWNGKTLRKRFYISDFKYKENGVMVVEDVKSKITAINPVYTLKRQLFLIRYPEYNFKEV